MSESISVSVGVWKLEKLSSIMLEGFVAKCSAHIIITNKKHLYNYVCQRSETRRNEHAHIFKHRDGSIDWFVHLSSMMQKQSRLCLNWFRIDSLDEIDVFSFGLTLISIVFACFHHKQLNRHNYLISMCYRNGTSRHDGKMLDELQREKKIATINSLGCFHYLYSRKFRCKYACDYG